MIELLILICGLGFGYAAAYLIFKKEVDYLRCQNADLLGDMHHRHGYKPVQRTAVNVESAETPTLAATVTAPEKYTTGMPDLFGEQSRRIAEQSKKYKGYTPAEWLALPEERRRELLNS